jgi:hypothetical protein
MKIIEVEKRYKDEWVLAEILKENAMGKPIDVKVLAHSKNRDITYAAIKNIKGKYTYHFYTGKVPKKGYAVAFAI